MELIQSIKKAPAQFINILKLTLGSLLVAYICGGGCATRSDPLAGWRIDYHNQPDPAIERDYHDYIQKLPANQNDFIGTVDFLRDDTGRHAIHIKVGANNRWWEHVLIYDKDNRRIQVLKYRNGGGYRS
jgi:hypothetical protein